LGSLYRPGIPDDAKKVLVPAIEQAIKTPELMTKLQRLWYITNYKSPAELKQMLTENYERAKSIARKMGVTKKRHLLFIGQVSLSSTGH
jgi:tripartite-type tricarboxylate transporter receptor subunit TctC